MDKDKLIAKLEELVDLLEREIGMLYDISGARRNKANYTNVTLLSQEIASLKAEVEKEKQTNECIHEFESDGGRCLFCHKTVSDILND